MLNRLLSKSKFGGYLVGVPTSELITARLVHVIGSCTIVTGAEERGNGTYIPFARCWICGRESIKDLPSYATLKRHMDAIQHKDASKD